MTFSVPNSINSIGYREGTPVKNIKSTSHETFLLRRKFSSNINFVCIKGQSRPLHNLQKVFSSVVRKSPPCIPDICNTYYKFIYIFNNIPSFDSLSKDKCYNFSRDLVLIVEGTSSNISFLPGVLSCPSVLWGLCQVDTWSPLPSLHPGAGPTSLLSPANTSPLSVGKPR